MRDVLLLPAKFRFTLISHNRKVQGFFLLNSVSHKFIPNFHFYFLIKQKGFFVVPGEQSNDIEFLLLCINRSTEMGKNLLKAHPRFSQ